MINAAGVVKTFGNFKALDGLSLHVKKGSVYGLVGPNGAGKTTIIKTIMGVYRADEGEVRIDSEITYENKDIKKKVICISDDLFFYPTYSIMDTAKLYAGIYPEWSWEKFDKMKEVFKIDTKKKVRRLSKGMQKQVAFWLGLASQPEVMILDEPVDGLDPVMRRNVWKLMLQAVAEKEMTVLVSSHNLRELEDVCDYVGILHEGKVVIEKSLDDIRGNIHKLQVAFSDRGFPDALDTKLEILNKTGFGSVNMLIVKGDSDEVLKTVGEYNPVVCDILPLTLEEVFIYELGGMGYEFETILL
ncbi:MAG: ABC transporter ATP-binding protein [Clostridia bacterium]|nr:ABC transporter ATP-binding protein [Clostridia bacterium]